MEKQKKGEHKGIRYISNITQDNEKFVKAFLDAGIRIRHVKNLPPMSFGVSDKEIVATIEIISKSIIDAHGGKIWGKNNYPEDKGATFGFSLPLHNEI